jgi:hypothetical protein
MDETWHLDRLRAFLEGGDPHREGRRKKEEGNE